MDPITLTTVAITLSYAIGANLISSGLVAAGKEIVSLNAARQIKKAFNESLHLWCRNSDIRDRTKEKLFKEFNSMGNPLDAEQELSAELESFIKIFKTILPKYDLASESLTSINDEEKHKEILSSIESVFEGIDKVDLGVGRIERGVGRIEDKLEAIEGNFLNQLKNFSVYKEEHTEFFDIENHLSYICKEANYIPRTLHLFSDEDNFFTNREELKNLEDLIYEKDYIVVLSDAGKGKSVELENTALSIFKSGIYTPIYSRLRLFTSNKSIEDFLPSGWTNILSQDIVLFFDGLDELGNENMSDFNKKLHQFIIDYPLVKVVVSCRTNFYTLPKNKIGGTLRQFTPYYLDSLTYYDVTSYASKEFGIDGDAFLQEALKYHFEDLVFTPFFLVSIINKYNENKNTFDGISRVILFKYLIESRLEWDVDHFMETTDFTELKFDALETLRYLALVMTTASSRVISIQDLRVLVNDTDRLDLIKHCTLFRKVKGSNEEWEFEHNLFCELLCAEQLKELSFDKIVSLIKHPYTNEVLPYWLNTVGHLVGILDDEGELMNQLVDWIIDNDQDVVVRLEPQKISEDRRFDLFKGIFNYYKEKKIWLRSNKFSTEDLASFAESNESASFLLDEIHNKENHRRTKLNALSLLEGMNIKFFDKRTSFSSILKLISESFDDPGLIGSSINTLGDVGFLCTDNIAKIYSLIKDRNHQYIRTAFYQMLLKSEVLDKYAEYILGGITIEKEATEDRDSVRFADESMYIGRAIKGFASYEALDLVVEYWLGNRVESLYLEKRKVLESLISNSIKCYQEDRRIYGTMLRFYIGHHLFRQVDDARQILRFFNETQTSRKAYTDLLEKLLYLCAKEDREYIFFIDLFSFLLQKDDIRNVFELYKQGKINEGIIRKLYRALFRYNEKLSNEFWEIIEGEVDIDTTPAPDWDAIRKEKAQMSFNLLFDISGLQEEIRKIFNGKSEISENELWEIEEDGYKIIELDSMFVDSALVIVRDFANKDTPASIDKIDKWFKSEDQVEKYILGLINRYIKNGEDLDIILKQKAYIQEQFTKFINDEDVTKFIIPTERGSFQIKEFGQVLIQLFVELKLDCSEDKKLDMLSILSDIDYSPFDIKFRELIELIDSDSKVNERVVANINDDVEMYEEVLISHYSYAIENNLSKAYEAILISLKNSESFLNSKHRIFEMLICKGILCDEIVDQFESYNFIHKLELARRFIKYKKYDLIIDKLEKLVKEDRNKEYELKVIFLLIDCSKIEALNLLYEWTVKYKESPFKSERNRISRYSNLKVLPLLVKLLELSYHIDLEYDFLLDRMDRYVLEAIQELALCSKENYEATISQMKDFVSNNIGKLEDVEFLNSFIIDLANKFSEKVIVKYSLCRSKQIVDDLLFTIQ